MKFKNISSNIYAECCGIPEQRIVITLTVTLLTVLVRIELKDYDEISRRLIFTEVHFVYNNAYSNVLNRANSAQCRS